MIPTFPNFKKIELTDRKDIEKLTSKFPPYADFNFSNMWAWDLKDEMGFSVLNGNLVVKFTDYLNGQPFLSFIGDNMVNETVRGLVAFSIKNYKIDILKLVPETVVNLLDKKEFKVTPDVDSRDYIYSIPKLATMDAWPKSTISKGIRRFTRESPDYVIQKNSIEEIFEKEYFEMFQRWSENKNVSNHLELNEYQAFKRLFELKDNSLKIISLYKNNLLLGFDIYETCSQKYVLSHFCKADTSYHENINSLLNWEEAKIFNTQGLFYFNWQQDLGIPGLRKSKAKYKPDLFLKKFIVQIMSNE